MNAADHQLLDWLTCRARPGDLLMTGGPSRISHLIQTITGSPYSHTAVVLADSHVVEAFDVPLTLADDDDGAYRNDLADVVTRDVLRRVALRRPVGLDTGLLLDHAAQVVRSAPTFPTVGAAVLGLILLADRLGGARLDEIERNSALVRQALDRVIDFVADGAVRAHCSELSARPYVAAGLVLEFEDPALMRYIRRLGTAPHHRTLGDVLHLSGPIELIAATGRPAATGRWIRRPSRPGGLLAHLGDCREALVTAIRDLLRTTWDRLGEETPPEAADLIVPGDFTTARPFVTVGVVQHDRGRWQDAGIHA